MSFFSREKTIAPPGYNRWKVPIAALSIHLCIGQIYAFSVFNQPLTKVIGITESVPGDWKLTTLGWIFSIALFFLGASAATFGKWMERVGPRMAMLASALCFACGFMISSLGIHLHQIWLLYLGSGVIGGIGLGLGYISPVSTLIKWFPDRPGMATGMAIMGFGGGGMIASPLSVYLMKQFSNETSVGVAQTFLVMGCLYFIIMMFGAVIVRVPAEDWKPKGFDPAKAMAKKLVTNAHVLVDNAVKTPQFYLLFMVLMLNVTAGIGVLGQASVMIQELFSVESVGASKAVDASAAAGFVMLLSLFNMAGRFIWSSLSDIIGRKNTYTIFFSLGIILYSSIPSIGASGSVVMFVATFAIIISMYGGGFATVPAYLRDLFGTKQVGAIHGRLLLAWSMAAILGPVLINYMRQYQIEVSKLPKAQVYSTTMYVMAALLVIGLICNLSIKQVHEKHHLNENSTK
ncbi:MAG TPA: OFA family MFS transporter [Chitinophagaceae bacterium]|nr:OFA family MFS transporter [Chitinophagaceae bacterium]HQX72655.1 OFA family MFS transporter [Chitinophagaceae bacterium]HQZ74783.1 OFA family MFS transporter [Chitinophagaceae bacterium]